MNSHRARAITDTARQSLKQKIYRDIQQAAENGRDSISLIISIQDIGVLDDLKKDGYTITSYPNHSTLYSKKAHLKISW